LGDLKIFGADLTDELSFDAPIAGCDLVFHIATPVNFASQDPEVKKKIKKCISNFSNVTVFEFLMTKLANFVTCIE